MKKISALCMVVLFCACIAMPPNTTTFAASESPEPRDTRGSQMYAFVNMHPETYDRYWVRFDLDAPDEYEMIPNDSAHNVFAATYNFIDGKVYAVYTDENYQYQFGTVDIENNMYTTISSAQMYTSLAFDHTTGLMYTLYAGRLYRLDIYTGQISLVGQMVTSHSMADTICINNEGILYMLTSDSYLYTVDKSTAECTLVGNTRIPEWSGLSMTYNYETDTLYTTACSVDSPEDSGLYRLNTNNGIATRIGSVGGLDYSALHSQSGSVELPDPVPASGITLNITESELIGGETIQLEATVTPLDAYVEDRSVTWTSSDEQLATVSDNGFVTTTGNPGTVTITATSDDNTSISATCTLTILDPYVVYRDISDALNVAAFGEYGYYLYTTGADYPVEPVEIDGRTAVCTTNAGVNGKNSSIFSYQPIYMEAGDTVSFDWKTSTLNDWSYAKFYVNGTMSVQLSGEHDWATHVWTAPESGLYSFSWSYERLYGEATNSDCVWFDNFVITKTISPGDVNADGFVNTGDVSTVLKYCIGITSLTEAQLTCANVNGDDTVNTGDAAALLSLIMTAY